MQKLTNSIKKEFMAKKQIQEYQDLVFLGKELWV